MKYTDHFSTKRTSQNQPIPRSTQVPNNAGGYAWQIDDWTRLDRFLILGTEGGTYYVSEQDLTVKNAESVLRCLEMNGSRVVDRVVEISVSGRAHKNDPALFVLALAASCGNDQVRRYALESLTAVARTGTHLFTFLEYVQAFRGWGRGLREAVAGWYTRKDIHTLAYQVVKYRQRNGWTHADALRKAHPVSSTHNGLFKWIVDQDPVPPIPLVQAFVQAQVATTTAEIVDLITTYDLPRECIPTVYLNDPDVWRALLVNMPLTALIRNVGKLGSVGVLVPGAWDAITAVCDKLDNSEIIRRARVHPISVLAAMLTYTQGHGERGNLTWTPVAQVLDALDGAFYPSFENVEPTNQRILLALDVSGSMGVGQVSGVMGLTPRMASAAMAMVTAQVEPHYLTMAFSDRLVPVTLNRTMSIFDILNVTRNLPFGRTDCAQPMLYALERGLEIDTFIVYTDSETWSGSIHPAQALHQYRRSSGIPAKLVVVGMTSTGFSIADPDDAGMIDVIGFDTSTPQAISEFMKM